MYNALMSRLWIPTFILALAASLSSHGAEWKLDADGAWNVNGNWANPASFPNGIGSTADFTTIDLSSARTVSLNTPITVGTMLVSDVGGTDRYDFANGSGGSLTFDNGGTSVLTKTTGQLRFQCDVILNDMLVVNNDSNGGLDTMSTISGAGGITVNSGKLSIRQSVNTYSGPTILNNSASLLVYAASSVPSGGIIINGSAQYHGYYLHTMSLNLGSGNNSISFPDSSPGTASGFEWNNNMQVRFNNDPATVVTWGGGHFDMETLRLKNNGGTLKVITFQNILDLNGGDRAIQVQSTTNVFQQYAVMSGEIRNTGGKASLTKKGSGRLILSAANTYSGDTIVENGILQLNSANSGNDMDDMHIAESGATLTLNFAGTETIDLLYIGNKGYYRGEYGHSNSGADNGGRGVGALDAYFGAGTGKLDVTGGAPGTLITLY